MHFLNNMGVIRKFFILCPESLPYCREIQRVTPLSGPQLFFMSALSDFKRFCLLTTLSSKKV